VKGSFFLKGLGVFEQDVTVTEQTVKDVVIATGDEVIVQVRATVESALRRQDGTFEIDLRNVQPHKIVSVVRRRNA
jgi:hypothetical protein